MSKKPDPTTEQGRWQADIEAEAKTEASVKRTVETPSGRTKTVEAEGEKETETERQAEEKFTKSIKG
jgi:hypothetical protein